MGKPSTLRYYALKLPMRSRASECLRPPVIQLLSGDAGRLREVELNEAQLLTLLREGTEVLWQMYRSRSATQPDDCPKR